MSGTHTSLGGMNDGRAFTNYSDICALNSQLMTETKTESWDMHTFKQNMQSNGLSMVKEKQGVCGPIACRDLGAGVTSRTPQEYSGPAPYSGQGTSGRF